jgi:hypothetical protein
MWPGSDRKYRHLPDACMANIGTGFFVKVSQSVFYRIAAFMLYINLIKEMLADCTGEFIEERFYI